MHTAVSIEPGPSSTMSSSRTILKPTPPPFMLNTGTLTHGNEKLVTARPPAIRGSAEWTS
jgi:hypothetical protein